MTIDMNHRLFNLALMDRNEREELARVVQTLPKNSNSTIVEVGSFMGGSAAIMTVANPATQIHCFDLFEDDPKKKYRAGKNDLQYELFYKLLGGECDRSIENVRKILAEFKNVYLHKKRSPNDIIWELPIDLYFEDGMHVDPVLSQNLSFWSKRVKNGGYVLIHDCRPWLPLDHHHRFVDVERAVVRFTSDNYTLISHVGSLVVLQKT